MFPPINTIPKTLTLLHSDTKELVALACSAEAIMRGRWYQNKFSPGYREIPPYFDEVDDDKAWLAVRGDIDGHDSGPIDIEPGRYIMGSNTQTRSRRRRKLAVDPLLDIVSPEITVNVERFYPSPNMRSGWAKIQFDRY